MERFIEYLMMVSVAQDNLASNGRMMVNNELEKM
jgi:hypothetical protein